MTQIQKMKNPFDHFELASHLLPPWQEKAGVRGVD
jgi:hypothetical protein